MTPDQRFALLLTGMGLMFSVLTVLLGLLVRVVRRFTTVENRLTDVMQDVRDDRAATNERLIYLEHYVWPTITQPAGRPRSRG